MVADVAPCPAQPAERALPGSTARRQSKKRSTPASNYTSSPAPSSMSSVMHSQRRATRKMAVRG